MTMKKPERFALWVAIGSIAGAAAGYALHDPITGWAIGAAAGIAVAFASQFRASRSR
jgi:hypothetical protein